MEIVRLKEAGPFKPREYIIKDIVPVGVPCMLYAAPGNAKSILAASLASHVAIGIPWLGRDTVEAPIIFVDMELTTRESFHRFHRIALGMGLESIPDNVLYVPAYEVGYDLHEVLSEIEGVVENTGARLVVLDSLSLALEVDPSDARQTIKAIKTARWLENHNAGLIFIDHQGKTQQGESYGGKTPYGTVFKRALCRIVLQLKVDGQTIGFRYEKNNFSDMQGQTFSVLVDWNNETDGPIVFHDPINVVLKGKQMEIYHALLEKPLLRKELSNVVGSQGLSSGLKRLEGKGLVEQIDGVWSLTIT